MGLLQPRTDNIAFFNYKLPVPLNIFNKIYSPIDPIAFMHEASNYLSNCPSPIILIKSVTNPALSAAIPIRFNATKHYNLIFVFFSFIY